MLPRSIDALDDAYDVIRHYNLHLADFGAGSAEGFAAHLFVPGTKVWSVWHLRNCLTEYRNDAQEHASRGQSLDENLKVEVRELLDALVEHDALRDRLAEAVRAVKYASRGGAVWALIAELATTAPDQRSAICQAARAPLASVTQALADIRACAGLVHGSPNNYAPGDDTELDAMIRMDIERLDATLESAKPWDGREAETAYELEALFNVASDRLPAV